MSRHYIDNKFKYHQTTVHCLEQDMFALYTGELIKVIKLAKKKLTNKGFIYEFDIEGGNGKLIENGGKRIAVIKDEDTKKRYLTWYV
uniref:Uncharacterized protein n=1 Tax=Arsenophonus endosymbiont of Trialeurodes vaporariorum TaxID=235567 RepID=A0A3B0MMI8_9GAMM